MTKTKEQQLCINSTQTVDYPTRTEMLDGKTYRIVPLIMLVEGVHAGSRGPILHSADNIMRSARLWNGVPVTVHHPEAADGSFISACSPEQLPNAVGFIHNARWEDDKLKAEAWLDSQKLIAASPQANIHIMQRRPLEVSVGLFSEEQAQEGEWHGEQYHAVATNYQPDHLALLPGAKGACSWEDGCGIRVNCKTNDTDMKNETLQTLKQLNAEGYAINLINNEGGFLELLNKISKSLDTMDNDIRVHFLEEVYDDHYIYRTRNNQNGESRLYKQEYSVAEGGEIETSGEPVEVRKQVEYVTMEAKTMRRTNSKSEQSKLSININEKGGSKMSEKVVTPCTAAKVDALIANEATRFEAADKEWLRGLSEEQLNKLEPQKVEQPQVNKEQAIEVLGLKELKDYVGLMPEAMQAQVNSGLKLREDYRKETIKSIMTNAEEGVWAEDELNTMSCEMLGKINKSIRQPVDYSGGAAGGGEQQEIQANESGEEPLLPAGVGKKTK